MRVPSRRDRRSAALALLLLLAACQRSVVEPSPAERELLVGAHYYLWFPSRFTDASYLRARLSPRQRPQLGEYSSSSSAVVEQHIAWAQEAGIDFFSLDWWPSTPQQNALIEQVFLRAGNASRIRFCIFYELQDLGYDAATGTTRFGEREVASFLSHMDQIASRYFAHPSYLRVEGRPVIILYLTRTAVGRFAEAMERFRAQMKARGIDPFVIGDEIFWQVAEEDGGGYTDEPQPGRIALFDAITAYNLYDSAKGEHAGYGAASGLVVDSILLYEHYRRAAPETPLVPLALPGYNDRGHRLANDHFVVPRAWAAGAEEGSFFAEWLERFALPQLDSRVPMLLVTSWNEWSEDTAIEPVQYAPATSRDGSSSGRSYTQGYAYEGYSRRYLGILREKTAGR